jgi:hypothetical protein
MKKLQPFEVLSNHTKGSSMWHYKMGDCIELGPKNIIKPLIIKPEKITHNIHQEYKKTLEVG